MKKLVIGLAVFGTFVLYSLGIRDKSPVLSKPVSLATIKTPSSSSSTSSTPASSTSSSPASSPSSTGTTTTTGTYKDGTYKGTSADAYYGNVQVSATISGGKITAVTFLDSPHTHDTSIVINQQAMPYLQQEAIQAQSANVQIVSGATFTSQAFVQSLSSALSQAKA
ncbi:MAG: FMN-binding protein [Candidatus Saccharibacteria bacterium]